MSRLRLPSEGVQRFRLALVAASLALVLVPSGAVGQPPLSGTLAYQLCRGGGYCDEAGGWLQAWDLGQAQARLLTSRPAPVRRPHFLAARFDDEPAWSPDGNSLAFVRVSPHRSGIYLVGADGKGLRRIARLSKLNAFYASEAPLGWSPDGKELVFDRYGALEACGGPFRLRLTIARIDGSAPVDVPVLRRATKYWRLAPVGWSPDSKKLLYFVYYVNPGDLCPGSGPAPSQLYTIGADGRGRRLLVDTDDELDVAAWSPDGHNVAYATDDAFAVIGTDGGGQRTIFRSGDPAGVLGAGGGIVWSATGDEVIVDVGSGLFAINASSRARRRLGASGEILGLSRDGQYVAVWGQRLLLYPIAGGTPTAAGNPPIPKGVRLGGDPDLYLR